MLAAEKFSSPFANRDLALEPDYAPDKMRRRSRVQPELVDNFDFLAHADTKLVAPLLSCASNARTTASGFDMMDKCVSVSRTCVLHGDAFLLHAMLVPCTVWLIVAALTEVFGWMWPIRA